MLCFAYLQVLLHLSVFDLCISALFPAPGPEQSAEQPRTGQRQQDRQCFPVMYAEEQQVPQQQKQRIAACRPKPAKQLPPSGCAGLRSAHRERRPAPRSRPRRPADCFPAASRPGSGAQPMRPAPALPAAWPPPAAAASNFVSSFPVFHPWRSPLPLFCSSLCRHAEKKDPPSGLPDSGLAEGSLANEGHAVRALLHRGIGLVGADLDALERAVVFVAAVVPALGNGALVQGWHGNHSS